MGRIIDVNILEQCKNDLKRYAMYVNRVRIMPHINDGLKSVHRRIIYGAYHYEKAIRNNRVKSATIVGTVLKTMHPHGDAGVYNAMKPMSNWFEIYIPLLNPNGNWGNFQGDDAAAMRYTETAINSFTLDCVIGDLQESQNAVDWDVTYDEKHLEPVSLSPKVPLLLINGVYGLGYGLRINIPSHNINEVIDETLKLIKNPNHQVVLVPDQCMPCHILNTNFKKISNMGGGRFVVRGNIDTIDYEGKPALVITSTPDKVFLDVVTDKIKELIVNKKLLGVVDLLPKSSSKKMEYIIVLKRGTDPEYIKEFIYKNTDMQKSFTVNFECLYKSNPVRLSYTAYLQYFIEYGKGIKYRLYSDKMNKVKTRKHELETYIYVLESGKMNDIIRTIQSRTETSDEFFIDYIMKTLNVTSVQAKFILATDLKKLSLGYLNLYKQELAKLVEAEKLYIGKLSNPDLLINEIKDELLEIKKKYGCKRRSDIIDKKSIDALPGDFKIIITENNFIKKVPLNESIGTFKADTPKFVIKAENRENVLLFDATGRVFKLPVHKIPVSPKNSNGIDIRLLVKKLTSNICAIKYEPILRDLSEKVRKYFITILTEKGNIKKLDIQDFLAVPPSGFIYIKLDNDDYVNTVLEIANELDIITYSKNKALRMNLSEVPHQKRNTKGMKSMNADEVDGLSIIYPDTTDVVVVTKNGYINRFSVVALPNLGRNNKACSKVISLHKGDEIKSIFGLKENNTLCILTKNDKIEIPVSELPISSSISAGKKVIPMKNDNIIQCKVK